MASDNIEERLGIKTEFLTEYKYPLAVLATFVIGLSIRIWNSDIASLGNDAAMNGRVAQNLLEHSRPAVEKFGGGFYSYTRGIFNSINIAISYLIFGINTFAVRFPGIVWGSLISPVGYLWGSKFANKKTGVILALFLALMPWQISTSRYTRFYPLVQTLLVSSLITFYYLFEGIKKEGKISKRLTAFLGLYLAQVIALFFTHQFFPLAIIIPVILIGSWQLLENSYKINNYILISAGGALAITLLLFTSNPINSKILSTYGVDPMRLLNSVIIAFQEGKLSWISDHFLRNYQAITSLAIIGFITHLKHKDWKSYFAGISALTTIVTLSVLVPQFINVRPRYMTPVIPFILFYSSYTITYFIDNLPVQKIGRREEIIKMMSVIVILMATITLGNIGSLLSSDTSSMPYTNHRSPNIDSEIIQASEFVIKNSQEDITVYISPLNSPTFHLGWEEDEVHKIRDLTTPKYTDGHRWADKDHAVGSLTEMRKKVRKDNQRGDVWVLIGDSWVNDRRQEWVKSNFEQVNKTFKGVELYKYRK